MVRKPPYWLQEELNARRRVWRGGQNSPPREAKSRFGTAIAVSLLDGYSFICAYALSDDLSEALNAMVKRRRFEGGPGATAIKWRRPWPVLAQRMVQVLYLACRANELLIG